MKNTAGQVFCPNCEVYLSRYETYVLMFGEVVCRHCDQLTGEFEGTEEENEEL